MNNSPFPTEPYAIEKMKPIHLSAVLAIEKKSFPQPWSLSLFMSEFTNRLATYLVLRLKRKVIGYIGYWYLFEEAHITTFAIHPDYRRQGLGKQLLKHALNLILNQGCHEVFLEVRISNFPAQNLYHSLGFTAVGIRKKYYIDGEDAIIMKKIMSQES
ncbi:ribosomal protein S18-alanine N-acetyltransferase [Atribacter laminatus]|jgi:ribosomal-protein-alanine N-acetyltransferase|uniref:Ribosomal-protein-alanine acetyltransferase n=1 Tax=Atribacter laminatus TaxID=2847778 RepID=A0A7T1ANM0_ATRLM|nr:ribosomal protein S18-alanine N-acetyltransferase [Atribacter laminatus]QPM69216.1 Ribosomal-protein-alanine acetyltransferase [Atribacter laminatus]